MIEIQDTTTNGLHQIGQMVTEFNDWCFDETRGYGDYDLVKTEYGYHNSTHIGRGIYVSYKANNGSCLTTLRSGNSTHSIAVLVNKLLFI